MTPQEIAEVLPELVAFAEEMLGGLPRKDQRAAGELYVRGLLTDGQRKSMQPMAARGGGGGGGRAPPGGGGRWGGLPWFPQGGAPARGGGPGGPRPGGKGPQ